MAVIDPSNKNLGTRNKLLLCFKPDVIKDEGVFEPEEKATSLCSGGGSLRPMKKKAHQRFSSVLKALFFERSVDKKLGKKTSQENSVRSSSHLPSKSKKFVNSISKNGSSKQSLPYPEEILRTNSNRSSLFSSNPSVSSSSSSSSSVSTSSVVSNSGSTTSTRKPGTSSDLKQSIMYKKQAPKRDVEKPFVASSLMCILVLCLVALVLSGKCLAILTCTSTWLFFAPRRVQITDLPDNDVASKECKKRVVMEGFLERNPRKAL